MLTWVRVWSHGCPRWVRRRLTRVAWAALPHVTGLGIIVGCGGGVWLAMPPWSPPERPQPDRPHEAPVSVPEPGGLAVLGIGAAMLWRVRR